MFMKKFMSKIASVALVGIMISTTTVFAAQSAFNSKFVDSNEWTYVTDCVKATDYSEVYVRITNIYKGDGSSSDYKKIVAQFKHGVDICTTSNSYVANKGTDCVAQLKQVYRAKGKLITFVAMGNDPALDCRIDGKLVVD